MEQLVFLRRGMRRESKFSPVRGLEYWSRGRMGVVVFLTDDRLGGVEVRGDAQELARKFRDVADYLSDAEAPPPQPAVATEAGRVPFPSDLDLITPELIIKKFSSPVLKVHLADVKKFLVEAMGWTEKQAKVENSLAADLSAVEAEWGRDDLIDADGQPVRGAKARVARALQVPYAGGYVKRVNAALKALAA